jgi:hypothetical protein
VVLEEYLVGMRGALSANPRIVLSSLSQAESWSDSEISWDSSAEFK